MSESNQQGKRAMEILDKYRGLVWPEIEKYLVDPKFPTSFSVPAKYRREMDFSWKVIKEYPKRWGKYLRPTLVLLACEAMGGKRKEAIKTAAAMQLSEEWMLIHDDFEDDSLKRRGKPALHRMYGAELAVNAGDILQTIMWKVLTDNQVLLEAKKTVALVDEFYRMLVRTAQGQAVEIKWTKENKQDFNDSDWCFIADGKTAYYTIGGPMRLGAIVAGATEEQLEALGTLGKYLGRCFQLMDDVLDVTGDFSGLKEKGGDIYEGKRTVILGHLLGQVRGKDKEKLARILAKTREEKNPEEVEWVIKKMESCGSIEHARRLAKEFQLEAVRIFEEELEFLSCQPARENLASLIDFVRERKH